MNMQFLYSSPCHRECSVPIQPFQHENARFKGPIYLWRPTRLFLSPRIVSTFFFLHAPTKTYVNFFCTFEQYNMAPDDSIQSLLNKLTTSLESVTSALPDSNSVLPPQDGISLLDVKTELLLAYLQNLVFLILVKIRNTSQGANGANRIGDVDGDDQESDMDEKDVNIMDEVVGRLVELRVYLEKGVKPLEGKLKYQIDKVLRAADTASRDAAQKPANGLGKITKVSRVVADGSDESDVSGDDSDASSAEIDELSYRPNPAAFARPAAAAAVNSRSASKTGANEAGVYRPPRITPTALPITTQSDKRAATRKPQRSSTIDDYIATELSTAPVAEPSIGSTIISGGRRTKSAKDREVEDERRDYEESNFVRLAPESKKDRLKRGGGGRQQNIYGGEEMAGLGAGLDRISRLTSTKRKGRMTEDGPRGDGFDSGAGKRRKVGGR